MSRMRKKRLGRMVVFESRKKPRQVTQQSKTYAPGSCISLRIAALDHSSPLSSKIFVIFLQSIVRLDVTLCVGDLKEALCAPTYVRERRSIELSWSVLSFGENSNSRLRPLRVYLANG